MCQIADTELGIPVSYNLGGDKIEFTLPVKEGTVATEIETKQSKRFRDDVTYGLLTITATSNGCEFTDKKIVATIKIFKFADAALLLEKDYLHLKDLKAKEIVDKGFILGNHTCCDDKERWFYMESTYSDRFVTKIYGAIVGEFVIMIDVCGGLQMEKIVNTIKIATKSSVIACRHLEDHEIIILVEGRDEEDVVAEVEKILKEMDF